MFNSVDIFTSRRRHFNECWYWCRTPVDIEYDIDLSSTIAVDRDTNEMCYEREPNGSFEATEVSNYESDNQIVGGSFMFDENFVTLETNDDVQELQQNDIVVYDSRVWRITNISRRKRKRQNQFSNSPSYKTFISLKR